MRDAFTGQSAISEVSYVVVRMLQRFCEFERPEGEDNLRKGVQVNLAPVSVKLRLRRASSTTTEGTSTTTD